MYWQVLFFAWMESAECTMERCALELKYFGSGQIWDWFNVALIKKKNKNSRCCLKSAYQNLIDVYMGLLTDKSLPQKSCSLVNISTNSYGVWVTSSRMCVCALLYKALCLFRETFLNFLWQLLQSVSSVPCNAQIKYVTELPKYARRYIHRWDFA